MVSRRAPRIRRRGCDNRADATGARAAAASASSSANRRTRPPSRGPLGHPRHDEARHPSASRRSATASGSARSRSIPTWTAMAWIPPRRGAGSSPAETPALPRPRRTIAGVRHRAERPRQVRRGKVADRVQLKGDLIVFHEPTIRHRRPCANGASGSPDAVASRHDPAWHRHRRGRQYRRRICARRGDPPGDPAGRGDRPRPRPARGVRRRAWLPGARIARRPAGRSEVDIVVNLTVHHAHYEVTSAPSRRDGTSTRRSRWRSPAPRRTSLPTLATSRGLRLGCSPSTFLGEAQQTTAAWSAAGGSGRYVPSTRRSPGAGSSAGTRPRRRSTTSASLSMSGSTR